MKIGILTYYGVHNHGALLQAYGMQQVLKEMGAEVEFLTYERNYDHIASGSVRKYRIGLSSIPLYIKYLFENGIGTFIYNGKKWVTLQSFKKNNLSVGENYTEAVRDVVCIGSDEVFSLEVGYNSFFYGIGVNATKVFSYAGSFGPTNLEDVISSSHKNEIVEGIERLYAIGVRDKNSKMIVEQLCKSNACIVCDPVILYGYKKELELVRKRKNRIKERYILLYSYDKNSNTDEEVCALKEFARSKGLKIYSVGYYHWWCDKNINVSPIELLDYFCFAEYVLTDTFHGAVLSIITNTQFIPLIRNNGNKLVFLLEQYGLDEYIIQNYSEILSNNIKEIDFTKVNKLINLEREYSNAFVKQVLEND